MILRKLTRLNRQKSMHPRDLTNGFEVDDVVRHSEHPELQQISGNFKRLQPEQFGQFVDAGFGRNKNLAREGRQRRILLQS